MIGAALHIRTFLHTIFIALKVQGNAYTLLKYTLGLLFKYLSTVKVHLFRCALNLK